MSEKAAYPLSEEGNFVSLPEKGGGKQEKWEKRLGPLPAAVMEE